MLPAFVYAQEAPLFRVVYLWDVTYSTHGWAQNGSVPSKKVEFGGQTEVIKPYEPTCNIYGGMVKALISHIEKISNVRTELVIVPFNDEVQEKDIWRAMATPEGKQYLINKIKYYHNAKSTYTNIYAPFMYAKEKVLLPKAKYHSDLIVLTDGGHTGSGVKIKRTGELIPSTETFHNMLRNWCDFAEPNNVNGYYFMVTSAAMMQDARLKDVLKNCTCFKVIPPDEWKADLTPPTTRYSISSDHIIGLKEEMNKPILLNVKIDDLEKRIQGKEKICITTCENPYLTINEVVTLDSTKFDGQVASIEIQPCYHENVRALMPTAGVTSVMLNISPVQESGLNNELLTPNCELRFVNKQQKKITIKLKSQE